MAYPAERINVVQFPNRRGFVKLSNESEMLESLLKNGKHKEFALLTVIALRSRRTPDPVSGLDVGQCFLGDFKSYGMTEREYRTAKKNLDKWGLASFKATNKGTVASLANTAVYDINAEKATGNRRTDDEQATTNKNDKIVRKLTLTSSGDDKPEPVEEVPQTPKAPAVPYQEIVNAYHRNLPELPRVVKLTVKRKKQIAACWKDVVTLQNPDGSDKTVHCDSLEFWEKFFKYVSTRDFLMGRKAGSTWCADLEFLTREEPFLKILGGGYANDR